MKPKSAKKLSFNRETVSNLNNLEMGKAVGGTEDWPNTSEVIYHQCWSYCDLSRCCPVEKTQELDCTVQTN